MLNGDELVDYHRKRFWAEVDLDSAKHNYIKIREALSENTKLCCVVKANAYGHGAVQLAKLYQELGVDFFAVSNIEEAMQLRKNNIQKPILILGYTSAECAEILADYNISQAVFSLEYAEKLNKFAAACGKKIKVHIKFDSGMGRLGFSCKHKESDMPDLNHAYIASSQPYLETEGVFTHFAVADEGKGGEEYTKRQLESFEFAISYLERMGIKFQIKHTANSAAICDYSDFHFDMVRAGIVLYGENPSYVIRNSLELVPVMSLKAVVSQVKTIDTGDAVSYGRTYVAESKRKIATVPVGYADGFWRSNAKGGFVLVKGKRASIIGRVCMDQIMIDVTEIFGVEEGDIVTIMGRDGENSVTAKDLAKLNDTINYEILCAVGERVPRFYIKDGKTISVKDNIISD